MLIKKILPKILVLCCCITLHTVALADNLIIGVPNNLSATFWVNTLGPTLDRLRKSLPHHSFQVKEFSPEAFEKSIHKLGIDFFVGSPFLFWQTVFEEGGVPLATRRVAEAGPEKSVAGVVVVRRDSNIKNIREVLGKIPIALPYSFGSDELVALRALVGDRNNLLSKALVEVGERTPGVASAVAYGFAEAGLLAYCELERLEEEGEIVKGSLRVLGDSKTQEHPCLKTTELYPGYVFGALSNAKSKINTEVAKALYSIDQLPSNDSWELPASFNAVDKALRAIGSGPYRYLQEWTPNAIWKRFSLEISVFLSLTLLFLIHVFRIEKLVKKRTQSLSVALREKEVLEKEAQENNMRLSALERVATVNQLSSVLAHDLRQPIGTISNFIMGLEAGLLQGVPEKSELKFVLSKIKSQIRRADELIQYVRNYAKQNTSHQEFKECDVGDIVVKAIKLVKLNYSADSPIFLVKKDQANCHIDPVGIELVILNLLKNAVEATDGKINGKIQVSVHSFSTEVRIEVVDNGQEINEETLRRLSTPLQSIKEGGLGLGLPIARSILCKFGAQLSFEKQENIGLKAIVSIPRIKKCH